MCVHTFIKNKSWQTLVEQKSCYRSEIRNHSSSTVYLHYNSFEMGKYNVWRCQTGWLIIPASNYGGPGTTTVQERRLPVAFFIPRLSWSSRERLNWDSRINNTPAGDRFFFFVYFLFLFFLHSSECIWLHLSNALRFRLSNFEKILSSRLLTLPVTIH